MAKYRIYTKTGVKDFEVSAVKSYEHGKNGATARGCIYIRLTGQSGQVIYSTTDAVKMTRINADREEILCKA